MRTRPNNTIRDAVELVANFILAVAVSAIITSFGYLLYLLVLYICG